MTGLEQGLRELVAELVAEEVKRQLAERDRPAEYLSTAEAGALAGVDAATVRRWVRDGKLPEFKAGRVTRVKRVDLEALLASGRRPRTVDLSPEARARRDFGV